MLQLTECNRRGTGEYRAAGGALAIPVLIVRERVYRALSNVKGANQLAVT